MVIYEWFPIEIARTGNEKWRIVDYLTIFIVQSGVRACVCECVYFERL